MKLTMERYAELDKTSYFKEEYDGYVDKYNKEHGTDYQYQFEMIHDLYENHDMNAGEISRIFNMHSATMGSRIRKMGLKTKKAGCGKLSGTKPKVFNFNGELLTIAGASDKYNININTLKHRKWTQKLSFSEAVNKPIR